MLAYFLDNLSAKLLSLVNHWCLSCIPLHFTLKSEQETNSYYRTVFCMSSYTKDLSWEKRSRALAISFIFSFFNSYLVFFPVKQLAGKQLNNPLELEKKTKTSDLFPKTDTVIIEALRVYLYIVVVKWQYSFTIQTKYYDTSYLNSMLCNSNNSDCIL